MSLFRFHGDVFERAMNAVWRAPAPVGSTLPWASQSIVPQFPYGSGYRNKTIQSIGDPVPPLPAMQRPGFLRAPNRIQGNRHIPANPPQPRSLNPAAAVARIWRVAAG